MTLLWILIIPLLLMIPVAALSGRWRCARQAQLLSLLMLGAFALALQLLPQVTEGGVIEYQLPWLPELGLSFSLYLDGLALLFVLVVTGMAAVVLLYAGYYFDDPQQLRRFFLLILLFISSMLLVVMAGNLITLFVAWELTSVVSFLLIGFKGSDSEARRGALQAFMITGAGGLALFVGLLLAGNAVGSMELSDLLASGDLLRNHPWYNAITILIMLGSFSKSAQFPLHFWLPGAMSAPTPASAFLHSATMVKAGVYLLLRLSPVLGNTPLWENGLLWVGGATALIAALLAMWQLDLKGILAYSTVSQLGTLVLLIGLPGGMGIKAALVGVLAHALYKGTLFLVVGAVDHATGTRNIRELGGLARLMPGYALVAGLVVLSMAGVPPFLGFVAKETAIEALQNQPVALAVSLARAVLTAAIAFRLFWDVFMRPPRIPLPQEEHGEHDFHHPYGDDAYDYSHLHQVPLGMVVGPAATAALSLVVGLGVGPWVGPLVSASLGKTVKLYLLPPSGFNLALGLSLGALAAGLLVFLGRSKWLYWPLPTLPSGHQAYEAAVRWLEGLGDALLVTQSGKVRYYLTAIMITVVVLFSISVASALQAQSAQLHLPSPLVTISGAQDLFKIALLVITLGATLASILFREHLAAILALGVAGYAVGGLFLLEPAPDVALVQFLVETLATVLVVLILARTSARERRIAIGRLWEQSRRGLGRDILIAALTGGAVTAFALVAISAPPISQRVPNWYLQNALPEVGVKDVVAGVITDFRGTDTLIEITVFSLAALGVLTMLARPVPGRLLPWFGRRSDESAAVEGPKDALQEDSERPEVVITRPSQLKDAMTQAAAYLTLPLAFLMAAAHLLYAGVQPGDGFTAGVIAGLGIALWYVVFGYQETRQRLRWLHPGMFIGLGLLLAYLNALLPALWGGAFLSFRLLLPFSLAGIKLASSLVFEIGIFLAVFGGMSAIMEAISHPKEVKPL